MARTLWVIKVGGNDQGISKDEATACARAREMASAGMNTVVFKRVGGHDYFVCAYDGIAEKAGAERRGRTRVRPTRRGRLSGLAERVRQIPSASPASA